MAVMEVNLPSGFTANTDSLPALRRYRGVKRVDTEKENTKVSTKVNVWLCTLDLMVIFRHCLRLFDKCLSFTDRPLFRNSWERRAVPYHFSLSNIKSRQSKTSVRHCLRLLWPDKTSSVFLWKSSSDSVRYLWSSHLRSMSRWWMPG